VLAVEREAGQDGVIEGVFDQVRVPGFASEPEHAPVPHHAGNSGAGLGISPLVRELEVFAERLSLVARAETAANVHAARGHVLPQTLQGLQKCGLSRFGVHISGTGVQIEGTDGVSGDLALVPERLMVLAVGWFVLPVGTAEQAVSAGVDEVLRAFEIPSLTGDPEQFYEGHLDLFVAIDGVALLLLRSEGVADVVGEARGDVEEAFGTCGPEVGHGCLEEVARAVHLVQVEVGPALGGPLEREVRVQVSVRPLSVLDLADGDVYHTLQLGVRSFGERPCSSLEPLVDVRVVEVDPLVLAADLA
jgi:hypothetical protein